MQDDLPPPLDPEDSATAAEYVLGLLPDDESEAFELRLLEDPALEGEVLIWTERLARLEEEVAPVPPDPAIRRRIEALAFGEDAAPRRSWWQLLAPYALGAVAAAGFAWVAFETDMFGLAPVPEPLFIADLQSTTGPDLLVHAGYLAETNEFLIRRDAGEVPEGRDQEMWLIAGDAAPVSLGLIPRETGVIARLELPEELVPLLETGILAVSLEPAGGSPTGQPTGPVQAAEPMIRL